MYMEEKWILPNEKKNSKMDLTKLFGDAMVNFRQAKQPYQGCGCYSDATYVSTTLFHFAKYRQDSCLDGHTSCWGPV